MNLRLRKTLFALLLGGLLQTASCGDIWIRSVKYGVYSYVGGSVVSGLVGGQVNTLLNNVLTGGLFTNPFTTPTT